MPQIQVAPVQVCVSKSSIPVTVSAAAGGVGQVLEEAGASLYVSIRNVGTEDCEYKVDSGGWLPLVISSAANLDIDLNTTQVYFRRARHGQDASLLVDTTVLLSDYTVGDDPNGSFAALISKYESGVLTTGWDDLRFPAQAINPAGAVNAPTVDTDANAFPGTLLFAGNADNLIAGIAQMSHSWEAGTAVRPHIHWSKPTGSTNAVDWVFYYRHAGSVGEVAGDWVGPISGAVVVGTPSSSNSHCLTAFGEIDMTGKKESSIIAWKLQRNGSTDADSGIARLYEFDIHYKKDKHGTPAELPA